MYLNTETEKGVEFVHVFQAAPEKEVATTLLLLHGTGGNENDLLDLGHQIAPQANLLGVRGRVLESGMPRFFRRLAEGVFDEDDLRKRTHELADFVSSAAVCYGFDPARVVAVGYSNGANIAGGLLFLRPGVLAGAALLRPMVPLVPNPLPALDGVSVLLAAGARDPLVSLAETERLTLLLRDSGATVTVATQQTGHNLTSADLEAAKRWLNTF